MDGRSKIGPADASHPIETWLGYAAGLLVMPLLVLLFAKTVTAIYGGPESSVKYATAIATTRDLTAAVDRYRSRHQRVPDAAHGLRALIPEFIERLPLDPWGHPFIYQPSDTQWADVLSYGADGRPGGKNLAADISGRYGRFAARPPLYIQTLGIVVLFGLPLAAVLGARRWRWAASMLAGIGTAWAILLFSILGTAFQISLVALAGLLVGLCCMVGSVATLRRIRGARALTCAAILAALLLFEHLITL